MSCAHVRICVILILLSPGLVCTLNSPLRHLVHTYNNNHVIKDVCIHTFKARPIVGSTIYMQLSHPECVTHTSEANFTLTLPATLNHTLTGKEIANSNFSNRNDRSFKCPTALFKKTDYYLRQLYLNKYA